MRLSEFGILLKPSEANVVPVVGPWSQNVPALRLLHSWGVPMDVKDTYGRTPADLAARNGHTDCAAFLAMASMGEALVNACRNGPPAEPH